MARDPKRFAALGVTVVDLTSSALKAELKRVLDDPYEEGVRGIEDPGLSD